MKTQLFFIACLLTLTGYAQNGERLDSMLVLNKDGVQTSKEVYRYDLQGQMIQKITDESGELIFDYLYDERGNKSAEIWSSWNSSQKKWVRFGKNDYQYDEHNRLVSEIYSQIKADVIQAAWGKREYQYDSDGHMILDMLYYYSLSDGELIEDGGRLWEYDAEGRIISYICKNYVAPSSGGVQPMYIRPETSKTTYQYEETDTELTTTLSLYNWNGEDWKEQPFGVWETVHTNTANGFIEEEYRLLWPGEVWQKILIKRGVGELDNFGNTKLEISDVLKNDNPITYYQRKIERECDEYNRLVSYRVYQPWEDELLALYQGQEISYTEKGNISERLDESYDAEAKRRTIYYYSPPTTAIPTVSNSAKIAISSNPVSESFQIFGLEGSANLSLFDLAGHAVIQQQEVNAGSLIFVNHLQQGMYVVRIQTPQGTIERKILKK